MSLTNNLTVEIEFSAWIALWQEKLNPTHNANDLDNMIMGVVDWLNPGPKSLNCGIGLGTIEPYSVTIYRWESTGAASDDSDFFCSELLPLRIPLPVAILLKFITLLPYSFWPAPQHWIPDWMQFIHEYAHLFVWEQRGQDRSTVIELHVNEIWNAKSERIFVPPAAVTGGFWHNIRSSATMTVRRESFGKSVEIIQT